MIDAAVWLRVSTEDQEHDNQVPDVERFAAHHDYRVALTYELDDSAWKDGGGAKYKAAIQRALDDAWQGKYKVLIVWALDRITREGAEGALRLIRQFRERGCTIVSVKESWLNGSSEVQDVLVAFAGWMAQIESKRKSDRVKAGIERRRAANLPVGGRKAGAKDKRPRRTDGYAAAWRPGGARREAARP